MCYGLQGLIRKQDCFNKQNWTDGKFPGRRTDGNFNFWNNRGLVKFSTIHSFKGWEVDTLFLIIEILLITSMLQF